MPENKRPADATGEMATDPTLTPTKALGRDATVVMPSELTSPSSGALPPRYRLGARLGAGGMGEVLLATDQQIGRDVAIKRMLVSSHQLEARFLREASIQGRLEHPAIVPVHELGTDAEGRPFFVMKRVTGTTLADILAEGVKPSQRQKLLRAFADVCLAVEFAHNKGIVHRDLKPANIMLGDFGEVYVLDWGIARILADAQDDVAAPIQAGPDATQIGAVLGTPGYMSPEQLRGQSIDGRSDVFALGCILFEIIGGQPLLPRTSDALEEAFSTVVRRASSRARLRDMAPELVALCIEATRLEVDQRLQSARELGAGVEKFLDGDRDLAARKELAEAHTAAARKALAAGDGEAERATAMRELGRAVALHPSGGEAAELVGRLMLEAPRNTPEEVEQRLAASADATSRRRSGLVAFIALGFLMFLPFLLWMGITDVVFVAAFAAAVSINGLFAWLVARRKRFASVAELHFAAVLNTLVIVLIARMFSPFLVAPGIAACSVMMFLSDPRLQAKFVIPLSILAVLGPWLLEVAGVLTPTTTERNGDLVLHSTSVNVALPASTIALALYVTALVSLAGLVARRLGETVRESLRTVELQAWHLRQLVKH